MPGLIDPKINMGMAIDVFSKKMMLFGGTREDSSVRLENENGIFYLICPARIHKKMMRYLEDRSFIEIIYTRNKKVMKDEHNNKVLVQERTFSADETGFTCIIYPAFFALEEMFLEDTPIGRNLMIIRKGLKTRLKELSIPTAKLKLSRSGRLKFDPKTAEYISEVVCFAESGVEKHHLIKIRHKKSASSDDLVKKAILKLDRIIQNCEKGS